MAERKPARKTTKGASTSATPIDNASEGFSIEERDAMRERARELKAAAQNGRADGESAVLAKIAEMPDTDRVMAERVHTIIMTSAPDLSPRLWYGMPAYARNGDVVCFFQGALKFKTRYATLGFSDKAKLDDGHMWPTSFALEELTAEVETRITELVKRAVGSG